jgi:hypothetical protein
MKNTFKTLPFYCLLLLAACSPIASDVLVQTISVKKSLNGFHCSDVLQLEQFTLLSQKDNPQLRGIDKVICRDGQMLVLDNLTDFDNLWLYKAASGKLVRSIGTYGKAAEQYEYINDVCWSGPDGDIVISEPSKTSFLHFNASGQYLKSVRNGVFGEEVALDASGNYIVYNEYNATPVSGLKHLLFYDARGNLEHNAYPYAPALDGNGFMFAGSLHAMPQALYFNPPFCDTIFRVVEHQLYPEFVADFGNDAIPYQLRSQKKLEGYDVDGNAFLNEDFFTAPDFTLIGFHQQGKVCKGIFDHHSGAFLNFREAIRDNLYELVIVGKIFPGAAPGAFGVVLTPQRLAYLLQNQLLNLEQLRASAPELAQALGALDKARPESFLLLQFSYHEPGAEPISQAR